MVKALSDPYEGVRWQAALALGKLGDIKAIEPLFSTLGDKNSSVVRIGAAEAIGMLGDPKVIERLRNAIEKENSYMAANDSHEKVKSAILKTIENIQGKNGIASGK